MPTTVVSVIIPSKGRPELTSQAIKSVLNQVLPPRVKMEIIAIDAYSKPPLKGIIGKNFPGIKLIKSKGYDSPGGTRNYGLKKATGDYICFLDNDDQWRSDFIKQSLATIKSSNAPATVCLTSPFFHRPFPLKKRVILLLLNLIRTTLFYLISFLHKGKLPRSGFYLCQISHMLFDRKQVKGVTFNERSIAAEDWEYFADITKEKTISIVLKPLVNFRYILNSNTNTKAVREKKWNAYQSLLKRLPSTHTHGILNNLFHLYIKTFS
jgi:glycosyltransferase involved in cell wall biosynthesis